MAIKKNHNFINKLSFYLKGLSEKPKNSFDQQLNGFLTTPWLLSLIIIQDEIFFINTMTANLKKYFLVNRAKTL